MDDHHAEYQPASDPDLDDAHDEFSRPGKRQAAQRAASKIQSAGDSSGGGADDDDDDSDDNDIEIMRGHSRASRYKAREKSRSSSHDLDQPDHDEFYDPDHLPSVIDDYHPERRHGDRKDKPQGTLLPEPDHDDTKDLDDELSNVVAPPPSGSKRKTQPTPNRRSTRSRVVSYREDPDDLSDPGPAGESRPRRTRRIDRSPRALGQTYVPVSSEEDDEMPQDELHREAELLREDAEQHRDERYPLRHRKLGTSPRFGDPESEDHTPRFSKRRSKPRSRYYPAKRPSDAVWTEDGAVSSAESSDDSMPDSTLAAFAAGGAAPPVSLNKRRYARPSKDRRVDISDHKTGPVKAKTGPNTVEPIKIDLDLDWNSIGGLDNHITALKEMVTIPLLYPEIFEKFCLEAPKGVLFYGPPGTGKTLCARALAASCGAAPAVATDEQDPKDPQEEAANRPKKPLVSFFMRNGADCLSKWVGEAERQLRNTFEAAQAHQPSIIFFDELDGLAPVRSSRQDQVHSSIVSTLLGLMDGLEARGRIIVIGATNRVDSIDPALRRAGRFDRELIFTLPNVHARQRILEIHTKDWKPRPSKESVVEISKRAVGYCGADIKSLCSEAALRALRRTYPQIYESKQKLDISKDRVNVDPVDFLEAMKSIVPASHRSARVSARPVPPALEPLLNPVIHSLLAILRKTFKQGMQGLDPKAESVQDVPLTATGKEEFRPSGLWQMLETPTYRPRLLISGKPGMGQVYLGPALLHALEGCTTFSIDMPTLLAEPSARCPEEVLVNAFRESSRVAPSIIYLPHLSVWWATASPTLQATLLVTLRDLPPTLPVMVLATTESDVDLPDSLLGEFPDPFHISPPSESMRAAMFKPLAEIINFTLTKADRVKAALEVLPLAPQSPRKPPKTVDVELRRKVEEMLMRSLRLEMSAFFDRLHKNRKYKVFCEPVDPSVAPDYYDIIKNPMDIHTILSNIAERRYITVVQVVSDADLMVKNAIDYNPPHTEEGAMILLRARQLIDEVHGWADSLDDGIVSKTNAIYNRRAAAEATAKSSVNVPEQAEDASPEDAIGPSVETKTILAEGKQDTVMANGIKSKESSPTKPVSPSSGSKGVTTQQQDDPMDTSPRREEAPGKVREPAETDVAPQSGPDRPVPEINSVRLDLATKDDVARLSDQWTKATELYCMEAMGAGYHLVLELLYEKRYDRDRSLVCTMISELLDELDSEPAILRFL